MKKYTKILSLICVLALSLSFLTVISIASGTGTQTDPFIITTAEELQNINNNVTAHYVLGNNIDLTGMDFTPIGNVDNGAFSGSFDGNGYSISNLNVYSGKYAGLFGYNEGIIKNVILDNIYVYGTRYVGGVIAYNASLGKIENCKVKSGLLETSGGIHHIQIGGICGKNDGSFNGCFSNASDIIATAPVNIYAGGICGYWNTNATIKGSYNTGNISSSISTSAYHSYIGGLVGYISNATTISQSYNTGNISSHVSTTSSHSYAGGLVGYIGSATTIGQSYNTGYINSRSDYSVSYSGGLVGYINNTATISESYNTGTTYSYANSAKSSEAYSGGLVGYISKSAIIGQSYNTGYIYSRSNYSYSYSGGFIGYAGNSINLTECYNSGFVYSYTVSFYSASGGFIGYLYGALDISECYNTGNISSPAASSASSSASGGFIGHRLNSTTCPISRCYNMGYISATDYCGGLIGFTSNTIRFVSSYSLRSSVVKGAVTKSLAGNYALLSEMKSASTYTGWNFEEMWSMGGTCNHIYPVLKDTSSPLTIDIPNKTMLFGDKIQLTAYKNGVKTTDVKWSVTNGEGTVNSSGLASPGVGLVTITATDNENNKANFNAYVIASQAYSISATNRTIQLTSSQVENANYFTVTGNSEDIIIDYQSSDTSILKVNFSGALTLLKPGTATITATTASGLRATQTVTIINPAESLSIPSALVINIGSSTQINATTSPNPTSSIITWTSSDESVATVDSEGNVTGLKCGTTIITATTDNGYTDTCTITVNAPLTEMAFETPSLTLYVGQEYKLKLNITPTDTTDTITYSTSSSTYASVTSAGTVTAKNAGTATITATSSSGKKAYCVVTVKAWPSVFNIVDSATIISNDVITTDTTNVRNIDKLLTVKDGYNIEVTYSHQINGLNYCGTGTTIDVYDDYGNFVITYTLVVNGDVNGDSIVDVLDATNTERMATDAMSFDEAQAYAANGAAIETVDATSYQYVLNKALAE